MYVEPASKLYSACQVHNHKEPAEQTKEDVEEDELACYLQELQGDSSKMQEILLADVSMHPLTIIEL